MMRSRRAQHTAETLAALTRAARSQFGKKGFEDASLSEIAKAARVTTGAIYHHFKDKKGLFVAVAEQIEQELLDTALSVTDPDPWLSMRKSFVASIDACARPDVQRITFIDAPRVVGPEDWREIELRYAYGGMTVAIRRLVAAGMIRPYPVELIAPVLLAVLAEAARAVAQGHADRGAASDLLIGVLESLRVQGPASG